MAYKISYGPDIQPPKAAGFRWSRVRPLAAAWFLVFVLLVRTLWPQGRELLRTILLPGDPTITQQAFSVLISDIRQGSDLGQALTVFCEEIIGYAD